DPGMMQARDLRRTAERAPERPAEESLAQVGPDGWRPCNEQPRDARRAPRKKGGTSGLDVSRPFGPVRWRHRDEDWRPHPIACQNRRRPLMADPTPTPDPALVTTTPDLHPIPSVNQSFRGPAAERTALFGGPQVTSLPAFTVSTRLRGRHVLVDSDLTPDEMSEMLETASRVKQLRKTGQ